MALPEVFPREIDGLRSWTNQAVVDTLGFPESAVVGLVIDCVQRRVPVDDLKRQLRSFLEESTDNFVNRLRGKIDEYVAKRATTATNVASDAQKKKRPQMFMPEAQRAEEPRKQARSDERGDDRRRDDRRRDDDRHRDDRHRDDRHRDDRHRDEEKRHDDRHRDEEKRRDDRNDRYRDDDRRRDDRRRDDDREDKRREREPKPKEIREKTPEVSAKVQDKKQGIDEGQRTEEAGKKSVCEDIAYVVTNRLMTILVKLK